ncbi:MAG: metal-dependent hydrolase [Erythrobacter sp.]|nr:metal-dependent hydrolase [Erythrobacter sp.]
MVFQEAFSTTALRTAAGSPHPIFALGPRRSTKTTFAKTDDPDLRKRNILRGEWGIKVFGSGLAVASRHPVSEVAEEPFGPRSCAGWDCLSNKGMPLVRVHLPGFAAPLEIVTTHMNSQRSSGVSQAKQVASHKVQSAQLAQFIDQHSRVANPLIIAGDFNMRGSPERFEEFKRQNGYILARRYCQERAEAAAEQPCEIAVSWDGDAPWMDTQDLQIFDHGAQLSVRPVKLEAWFDGDDSGGELSDHDTYIVTYAIEENAR